MLAGKPGRVFADRLPEIRCAVGSGALRLEPQHAAGIRPDQHAEIICAGRHSALGEQHVAGRVEHDLGDLRHRHRARLERELHARIAAEPAVGVERNRPDRGACRDRVIKPSAMHGEAEHPPRRRRIAPGRRIAAVELEAADIGAKARVERNGRQPGERQRLRCMIEAAGVDALQIEAVDRAGAAVGHINPA